MSSAETVENVELPEDLNEVLQENDVGNEDVEGKSSMFVVTEELEYSVGVRSPDSLDGAKISRLKTCVVAETESSTSGISDSEKGDNEDAESGEKTPVSEKRRPSAYEKEKNDETFRNRLVS